jgi:uncharacterized protein (TIGR03067 family)
MRTSIIIMVLIYALSCGVRGDAATSTDQSKLQGVWLGQLESQNGVKKNVSYQYIFKGDKINFIDETGMEMKYSFKLDTTGNPRFIIIRSEDTLTNSTPVSVGYELDGDSLKIVVAPAGLRPTDISDKNNQELIFCKRKGS